MTIHLYVYLEGEVYNLLSEYISPLQLVSVEITTLHANSQNKREMYEIMGTKQEVRTFGMYGKRLVSTGRLFKLLQTVSAVRSLGTVVRSKLFSQLH